MGKPITSPGFASPARDYVQPGIDLNEELILNPSSTFLYHVMGTSMIDAYVADPCTLVVDRSVDLYDNALVVAKMNGDHIVKLYRKEKDKILLYSCNKTHPVPPIDPSQEDGFEIVGVVTYIIINPSEALRI